MSSEWIDCRTDPFYAVYGVDLITFKHVDIKPKKTDINCIPHLLLDFTGFFVY